MANLKIITGDKQTKNVKGRLTFETKLVENTNGEEDIIIAGSMTTHRYIDDISKIESSRYILTGVEVYNEVFGSEDFNILYNFTAKDLCVKNGETNLSEELIKELEKRFYGDDDSKLWEGGE